MTSRRAGFQAAEADQVLDVLRRIQILAGRQRRIVIGGDLGQQRIIERIARLLEPAQVESPQAARISERIVAEKFRIGVDRQRAALRQDRFHRLDAGEIVGQRQAADFHLQHGIAGIEMAAHLVEQILRGLARRVPAGADIAEHLLGDLAAVVALGEHHMQRLVGDLGHRVPHRDLDGADADRALAVAAGFLVLHHHGEDLFRREIIAGVVEQRFADRPSRMRGMNRARICAPQA